MEPKKKTFEEDIQKHFNELTKSDPTRNNELDKKPDVDLDIQKKDESGIIAEEC